MISLAFWTLAACSCAVLVSIAILGYFKRNHPNLLDVYLIMVALYFGAYSLLDAFVNQAGGRDPLVIVFAFLPILAGLLLLWVGYYLLPRRVRDSLRFSTQIRKWAGIDIRLGIGLALFCLSFNAYLFIEYGMLTYVGEELEALNLLLPTWVGPARALVRYLGLTAYLFLLSAMLTGRKRLASVTGLLVVALAANYAIEGRRAAIELAVLTLAFWQSNKGRSIFNAKLLPWSVVAAILFFGFSNVYQTYRAEILSIAARSEGQTTVSSFSDALLNTDASIENYRARRAMWLFNYMIMDEQLQAPARLLYGSMLVQSLQNAIPEIFMPGKVVIDGDTMTALLYNFEVDDYPTNDFASFQTDFGFLSILALPALILLLLFIVHLTTSGRSSYSQTLNLFTSSLCLQYLMRIENSYGDFFILSRDLLLIGTIIALITWMTRIMAPLRRPALVKSSR